MNEAMEPNLAERVRNLPANKVDLLLKRLKARKGPQGGSPDAGPALRPFLEARDGNFQLVSSGVGALENLRFVAHPRLFSLEPDELEVEIQAACINFRDVALALGLYPTPADGTMPRIGCDAAGRVVAVGSDVTQFTVGDDVFFVSGDSTFAKYARVPEMRTFRKPASWTFEEASGLALTFTTVFYSLLVPGRLLKGERILIHCAAGGVGLAAIQLARSIGAEIFATSGTDEKREYLRSIGIRHVMDSRSLKFAEEIMAITGGEGVDVVLNSLPGEAIEAGLSVLRKGGRFLELGKRDLAPGRTLDLACFSKAITFAAVDIRASTVENLSPTVEAVRRALEDGSVQALPTKVYRSSSVNEAFRHMTLGKHIGRIAVQMKGEPIYLARVRRSEHASERLPGMSASASVISQASAWIEYSTPNPAATCRLFCFPYAGGSASIFRGWNGTPFEAVEICPIQIPGREGRSGEKPFTSMRLLCKAVADALPLDKPFAFFGHSVGALLAFEVARELRRTRGAVPFHLFASACSAPQLCPNRPPRFNLPREQLLTDMRKLGGTPAVVLESNELLDLVLPAIRADFALLDTYNYGDEKPFEFPITALGGNADLEVDAWEVSQWSTQTNREFHHYQLTGSHFFLHELSGDVQVLVANELDRAAPRDQ